jgi:hypothetical protein
VIAILPDGLGCLSGVRERAHRGEARSVQSSTAVPEIPPGGGSSVKRLACLGALAVLTLSPALAFADGPPLLPSLVPLPVAAPDAGTLTAAAHDLTAATGELAHVLAERSPEDPLVEHAFALHEAAARFAEDLSLGDDEALRQRFASVEHHFVEMRDRIRAGGGAEEIPEVHRAWARISEAHMHLTIAWYGRWYHLHPRASPGPHPEGPGPS